eukprot:6481193-Amphidinium_carterae.1
MHWGGAGLDLCLPCRCFRSCIAADGWCSGGAANWTRELIMYRCAMELTRFSGCALPGCWISVRAASCSSSRSWAMSSSASRTKWHRLRAAARQPIDCFTEFALSNAMHEDVLRMHTTAWSLVMVRPAMLCALSVAALWRAASLSCDFPPPSTIRCKLGNAVGKDVSSSPSECQFTYMCTCFLVYADSCIAMLVYVAVNCRCCMVCGRKNLEYLPAMCCGKCPGDTLCCSVRCVAIAARLTYEERGCCALSSAILHRS